MLFVGLFFGAIDSRLKLPDTIYLIGLVVFVYTIGLSSGPTFFRALRRQGLRDNLLCVGMLAAGAILLVVLQSVLGLRPARVAGMFAGSFTNTPALASILDYIRTYATAGSDQLLAEPVVGYSATYIVGVIGPMLAMLLARRIWHIDYAQEADALRAEGLISDRILQRTVRITHDEVAHQPVSQLTAANHWDVVFGRVQRHDHLMLANGETSFEPGDVVSIIGGAAALDRVTAAMGEPVTERLDSDRRELDYRRIFVSDPRVAGQRIKDLKLIERFGAVVTRVRRGDSDELAHGDTMLELGDRVRVVAAPEQMEAVSAFFGDSYRALSEVNILSLSIGLALGLLLGLIPITLPGGVRFSLGYAGGPLLVALILGARERTGPLVWTLPYSANLTLRQLGLILFLAGIGTRAGSALLSTFTDGNGLEIVLVGALATCTVMLTALWIGYKLLRIPMSIMVGMAAGMQTHPALLSFASEQTGNDVPTIGYTSVYPVATIIKIIIAQLMLAWMWHG